MRSIQSKILSIEALKSKVQTLKKSKKRIVSTNGCFDILHWGHLQYLEKARALGDVLICAINQDASVKKLKGPGRPIHSEMIRAQQIAALESVDFVVLFGEDTPNEILEAIQPDIHVKGGDYNPELLPEKSVVEQHGGKVQCLPLAAGFSTTELLKKLED